MCSTLVRLKEVEMALKTTCAVCGKPAFGKAYFARAY